MQAHRLKPHPMHPPLSVSSVEVKLRADDPNWLRIRWRIEEAQDVFLPKIAGKKRADGLWQSTCFEVFMQPVGGEPYCEWNFSPSRKWNAYDFQGYRDGMAEREIAALPDGQLHAGSKLLIFDAAIPKAAIPPGELNIGITAVVEEKGGTKSYWSLVHPHDDRADFHDPACFALALAAPLPS